VGRSGTVASVQPPLSPQSHSGRGAVELLRRFRTGAVDQLPLARGRRDPVRAGRRGERPGRTDPSDGRRLSDLDLPLRQRDAAAPCRWLGPGQGAVQGGAAGGASGGELRRGVRGRTGLAVDPVRRRQVRGGA